MESLSFTYTYEDVTYQSSVVHYTEDGYNRYRALMPDRHHIIIARFGIVPSLWVQAHGPKDPVYAHDLVQAIGEGVHALGI